MCPTSVAAGTAPLSVTVSSGATLFQTTYEAGSVPIERDEAGVAVLRVASDQVDLASLGDGDATIRVQLRSGLYRAEHVRRWHAAAGGLVPVVEGAS